MFRRERNIRDGGQLTRGIRGPPNAPLSLDRSGGCWPFDFVPARARRRPLYQGFRPRDPTQSRLIPHGHMIRPLT